MNTHRASHKTMPYRCRDCKKYFSVKTGTAMEKSKVPLRKWGWAIYLEMTNLKGVSSMKLHRDLGVTQKTAWFMLHRIREAFSAQGPEVMLGPVEVDETYVGGLERNKHERKKLGKKRWREGKTVVLAAKDRASNRVVAQVLGGDANAETMRAFVERHMSDDVEVYTDGTSVLRSREFNLPSFMFSS